jgi:Niemann-Pick C1 protein
MPAVRNFAAYAAGAVFINAVLQVTMFISVLALNQRRVEAGRADCVPCIRISVGESHGAAHGIVYGMEDESTLQRFIRKTYAPALLSKKVKLGVVTVFLGLFVAGLALIPEIQLGLDQRIAIPSDSYLIQYFDDLDEYFGIGPPVYFVTKELNITQRVHQEELCGRFLACDDYSLSNMLEQERKRPNVSYIADATASWVDDFFLWLNPTFDSCCTVRGKACFEDRNPPWNPNLDGMPEGQEYIEYLTKWLKAPTTADCPLAGAAAYGQAVVVDADRTTINASHFRTSHTALHSQADFINAYRSARRIAADISARNSHITVFPYSKFYIFFDQYTTIASLAAALLGSALALILLLSTLLLGSLRTALAVTLTVAMTLTCILGTMALAHVSLNAVSLVNLIISVGIALEFCAHVARAFTYPSASVMERAPRHAFAAPRGIVFSGITVTKLLGVAVLAFTRSKIFEVYYFRVWVALVVFGAAHALVFLPVLLSLVGGRGTFFLSSFFPTFRTFFPASYFLLDTESCQSKKKTRTGDLFLLTAANFRRV